MAFNPLRWAAFLVVFLGTSITLHMTQYISLFFLLPFSVYYFRRFNRQVMEGWSAVIIIVTRWFSKTKLVVSGDHAQYNSQFKRSS